MALRWQISGHTEPLQVTAAAPAPTVDGWLFRDPAAVANARLKNENYAVASFAVDGVQLTLAERTTPDKWVPVPTLPRWDVARAQYDGPFVAPVDPSQLTLPERTTPDRWHPQPNLPRWDVARNQWLSPPFCVDPQQLTLAERTTPDKWLGSRPDVLFRAAPYRPYAHYEMPPEEIAATVDDLPWKFKDPDPPLPLPRMKEYPSFVIDPWQLTLGERISLDKWFKETERPPGDVKRQQHLFPPFTVDAYQLTQGERITPDKWVFRDPFFPLPKTPVTRFEQTFSADETFKIVKTDWLTKAMEVMRTAPRALQFDQPLVQLVTAAAPAPALDGWAFAFPGPLPPRRVVPSDQFLTHLTLVAPAVPSADGWLYREPPVFRVTPRAQRSDQTFTADETFKRVTMEWSFTQPMPSRVAGVRQADTAFVLAPLLDLSWVYHALPTLPKAQVRPVTHEAPLAEQVDTTFDLAWAFRDTLPGLFKGPPTRLTPQWSVLPEQQPLPRADGWLAASPLPQRRAEPPRDFLFLLPGKEIIPGVEDLPWDFPSTVPPRIAPRSPFADQGAVAFVKLQPLDWPYTDTFLGFLRNVRRVPWGREGLEKYSAPPPPAVTAMDWYCPDQMPAFLRRRVGNEAMPGTSFLYLIQDLGRLVFSGAVSLRDLALVAPVSLSDDVASGVQL